MKTDQQKTILLVEDNEPLNRAISFKLEKRGYRVLSVLNAEDALDLLAKEKVDFGWFDLLLPGMSGMDLLKKIKETEKYKDMGIVIVSVSGGLEARKDALRFGAIDYIVKSDYDLNDLIDRVVKYIV